MYRIYIYIFLFVTDSRGRQGCCMGFLLCPGFSSFGKVMSDPCWRPCCTLSDGKRNNKNRVRRIGRRPRNAAAVLVHVGTSLSSSVTLDQLIFPALFSLSCEGSSFATFTYLPPFFFFAEPSFTLSSSSDVPDPRHDRGLRAWYEHCCSVHLIFRFYGPPRLRTTPPYRYPHLCCDIIRYTWYIRAITRGHSNQDQICSVKILKYIGFRVYGGSWLLRPPVLLIVAGHGIVPRGPTLSGLESEKLMMMKTKQLCP